MVKTLISIVVPAYNVEKYLNRCVESLINQSYKNLEIILVDDGAKDYTGEICDYWKSKDSRIKVVHKQNGGLGFARNTGIEYCTGDYISFVDSDDFVDTAMYEKMLNAVLMNDADTCYCSYNVFSNELDSVLEACHAKAGVFTGKEALLDIVGSDPDAEKDWNKGMAVWASLFSAKIIRTHKICFKSEKEYISEDLYFDSVYLPYAERVVVIPDCYYQYCVNGNSLTHKYYDDYYQRIAYLFRGVEDNLEKVFERSEYQMRWHRLFLGRVRTCLQQEVHISNKSVLEIIKRIKSICNEEMVITALSDYPIDRLPVCTKVFSYLLKYRQATIIYLLLKIKGKG